jgi:hypothetical protein
LIVLDVKVHIALVLLREPTYLTSDLSNARKHTRKTRRTTKFMPDHLRIVDSSLEDRHNKPSTLVFIQF